jgi:hypothetical protein
MPAPLMLQGTVKPDGTLVLDEKLSLPPGRVQVMLQPLAIAASQRRPVLEVIAAIRREQEARGHVPRTREAIDAEINELRRESEEGVREVERIYQQCQRAK